MIEIRLHGRFGQPVQKMARTIGKYALNQGRNVQVFDAFAAFRPGAPMYSIIRIADQYILERSGNSNQPDVAIVLDNSLFGVADVTKGLKDGGIVMALNVEKDVLGEKGSRFIFKSLNPYFENGADAEQNIITALKQKVL